MNRPEQGRDLVSFMATPPSGKRGPDRAGRKPPSKHRRLAALYAAVAVLFVAAVARETQTHGGGDALRWVTVGGLLLAVAAAAATFRDRTWLARSLSAVAATTGWVTWAALAGFTTPVWVGWAVLTVAGAVGWWQYCHDDRPHTQHGRNGKPRRVGNRWWTAPALTATLTEARVLPTPPPARPGQPAPAPPNVKVDRVEHDDYGATAIVRLPSGVLYSGLTSKREAIAAALNQPLHLVTITQQRSDPASVARLRVSHPYERTLRAHHTPEVTSWRDPLTIGRDRRGRDVTIPLWNTGQILVGGQTGSGKTNFLRLLVMHYASDPDASLFIVDGKGSTDDWGWLRTRATRLLFVHDDDPAGKFAALITEVQALVTERNRQGGRDWPGALVVLEEFSSMLASLDTRERRDMERAVTRLVQTCRSANVAVVIAAQRPSAATMDTNTRAQAAVSVAMSMKSARDIEMVLGHVPKIELPDEPGEAIVVVPGREDVLIDVDVIEDAAWFDLADRWPEPVHTPVGEPVDNPETLALPPAAPAPLLLAVADVLTEPMTAATLLERLPESPRWADVDPQPVTKEALGRDLAGLGLSNPRTYHAGRQARWYRPERVAELVGGGGS